MFRRFACSAWRFHCPECSLNSVPLLVEDGIELLGELDNQSCDVVRNSVLDHELEVVTESVTIWVLSSIELGTHRTDVHWIFDNVPVAAIAKVWRSIRLQDDQPAHHTQALQI